LPAADSFAGQVPARRRHPQQPAQIEQAGKPHEHGKPINSITRETRLLAEF
jgi:hypothetical protein